MIFNGKEYAIEQNVHRSGGEIVIKYGELEKDIGFECDIFVYQDELDVFDKIMLICGDNIITKEAEFSSKERTKLLKLLT